jgi:hypothetical protein
MKLRSLINAPFILAIKFYQIAVSPLLGSRCRFHPSCSQYALEAIQQHALPYAAWLTFKRLIRCQPLCQGGIDVVPSVHSNTTKTP